jgi:hypothetical protein
VPIGESGEPEFEIIELCDPRDAMRALQRR